MRVMQYKYASNITSFCFRSCPDTGHTRGPYGPYCLRFYIHGSCRHH